MKDPTPYDDDYYRTLGKGDQRDFQQLFTEKYNELDEDRAKESYKSTFEATDEPEHHLFRDIVNAFSSKNAADGSDSGFETTIADPLIEFGDTGAEVLLANKNPTGIHLCFVSCNTGGESANSWREDINATKELLNQHDYLDRLKSHIRCEGRNIRTVQYLTFTRDVDLVDADVEVLKLGTNPENYAVWKLIKSVRSKVGVDEVEEDKTIVFEDGHVEHPDLGKLGQDGIDPTLAENDDIRYSLTAHPIFHLGETCLQLYLDKLGSQEEPEEFTRHEFRQSFEDKVHLGEEREDIDEFIEETVESLLETALDYGILKDAESDDVEERDFRIMWDSENPGDIKTMIREKYFAGIVPEETGKLAFERAREQFEPEEPPLTDFESS